MTAIDRACRYILGLSFVATSLVAEPTRKPRISPLQTIATFTSKASKDRWSVSVKSTDGTTAYVLSLEPDFDVGHHPVTLELVLHRPGDRADGSNLLDPTGIRHGLQAYDFAADDLARGPQKSAFGENRTIPLNSLGLVVKINVSKAVVSQISPGSYQLDGLGIRIKIEAATPVEMDAIESSR